MLTSHFRSVKGMTNGSKNKLKSCGKLLGRSKKISKVKS